MKILLILLAVVLFSCDNNANQKRSYYQDSVIYYTNKIGELTDSGFTQDDSVNIMRKGRLTIYKTKQQYFLDKANELK